MLVFMLVQQTWYELAYVVAIFLINVNLLGTALCKLRGRYSFFDKTENNANTMLSGTRKS